MDRLRIASEAMAAARAMVLVLILALAVGCGEWVSYDSEQGSGMGINTKVGDFPPDGKLDHEALSSLMSRYLTLSSDKTFVLLDYDGLAASEDRYLLKGYLVLLAEVDPSKLKDKSERLAYWINAYNAAVVEGVLQSYKGDASFKVTDGGIFFDSTTFGFTFGGVGLSLNQLENGVLRGVWTHPGIKAAPSAALEKMKLWHKELWEGGMVDARFHAAVNCAALGCPNLLNDAPYVFKASTLEAQLTKVAAAWLDSEVKGAGAKGISKLFEWYADDFKGYSGTIEAFIKAHRTSGVTGVNQGSFINYDWTLNHKKNAK